MSYHGASTQTGKYIPGGPIRRYAVALTLTLSLVPAVVAQADPSVSVFVNPANTIPNVVANTIHADGGGIDWTASALLVELDQGSVYNDPDVDGNHPQDGVWDTSPDLSSTHGSVSPATQETFSPAVRATSAANWRRCPARRLARVGPTSQRPTPALTA